MSSIPFTWDFRGRRSLRLPGVDYSMPGTYGVTICTYGMECLFGNVVNKHMILNHNGHDLQACWDELSSQFPHITTDVSIVMPNHFHGIINILEYDRLETPTVGAGSSRPGDHVTTSAHQTDRGGKTPPLRAALGQIVGRLKYESTKRFFPDQYGRHLWQRNYWESIINTDRQYDAAVTYILNNPVAWDRDELNPNRK